MKWYSVFVIVLVLLQNSCTKSNTVTPNVEVLGHAGISLHRDRAVFPANSFESIRYAIDILDADGVEVDVQLTKDSVLVLYHDKYLDYSTDFSGCVSQFSYQEIKAANLDNTNCKIIGLEPVLKYIESRGKSVFLDIKSYDYCQEKATSITGFNYALENSKSKLTQLFIEKIIVSNASTSFLNQLNHPNKCLEISNVTKGVNKLKAFGFQSVLINLTNVSKDDLIQLNSVKWGVLGVKDEWTIDDAIKLVPKFIITDNIAYTNKVTN